MAISAGSTYAVVTFLDTAGNTTTRKYEVQVAVADVPAAVAALVALLKLISDCIIIGYKIYQEYNESDVVLPAGNVNIEETALFTGLINNQPMKSATLSVPGPKPGSTTGIFNADTGSDADWVNMAHTSVAAFIDLFEEGGNFYISDGEMFEAGAENGRRVHRQSHKTRSFRIG